VLASIDGAERGVAAEEHPDRRTMGR